MMKKVHTNNAPEAIGPYSQAIISNGMVYTSGQIAINPSAGDITADTISEQTEQVMDNLKAIVEQAGSDFSHVVKTTCFLSDMADFEEFNKVYGKYFPVIKPARSCFAVKQLPKNALVEVEVIAVVVQ